MLTDVERALVECVERGEPLDLAGERTVRASVIRQILIGTLAPEPDPHGIDLTGARIEGRLDLMNVRSTVAIRLTACLLAEGIDARYADLGPMRLADCRIESESDFALNGRQLSTPNLVLRGATIVSDGAAACYLREARIDGAVVLAKATVTSRSSLAFDGQSMAVSGTVDLREGKFEASSSRAAISLYGAHIRGSLEGSGAVIRNDLGAALDLELAVVERPALLRWGFIAEGVGRRGAICLQRADLSTLECPGATVRNTAGPAIMAHAAHVRGQVLINKEFVAHGAKGATVDLSRARVDGLLNCEGSKIVGRGGVALDVSNASVSQSVLLRKVVIEGDHEFGAVSLFGATIGEAVECAGAELKNSGGPALYANYFAVAGHVLLMDGFTASGSGARGAVSLVGAKIGGLLSVVSARLWNPSGPALVVALAQLGRTLEIFGPSAECTGSGRGGAVDLTSVRVAGNVRIQHVPIRNRTGCGLSLNQAVVGESVEIDATITGGGDPVALDLERASVAGTLLLKPDRITHKQSPSKRMQVDGLTFAGLPQGVTSAEWLALLSTGTPHYSAQAYQHLAAAEKTAGNDGGVRKALMAQRRDQLAKNALTSTSERAWVKLTGAVLGYGYQPWRALVALFATLLVAVVAAAVLGGLGGLAKVRSVPTAPIEQCAVIDRVAVGLDVGTPLTTSSARARCEPTESAIGTALTIAGWVLKVFAWAFATLFIAGFTGAVRKTT
ncbi:hypothetical protein M8542_35730 [Amycolatopsis sp. OK19-0408]|uniref:Membrane-associated oxidoreductase n=1 Tax=Amycolatopsis iheyensis TaxID=2945988 RepID=A0A9X2NIZ3_9PSEU|nr:hypothetical protein [Amycolatopsis iheyensis]MCR6488193.1 hypothetical protein [Amycolatopsis iheyensis]